MSAISKLWDTLEGRLRMDGATKVEEIQCALEEYVKAEDALPGDDDGLYLDIEEYSLSWGVESTTAKLRQLNNELALARKVVKAARERHNWCDTDKPVGLCGGCCNIVLALHAYDSGGFHETD